jgi:archaellum component FlaC
MERSHIVNNQGKVIADMAEKLSRFNTKVEDLEANSTVQISDYIKKLNNGNLFDAATAR